MKGSHLFSYILLIRNFECFETGRLGKLHFSYLVPIVWKPQVQDRGRGTHGIQVNDPRGVVLLDEEVLFSVLDDHTTEERDWAHLSHGYAVREMHISRQPLSGLQDDPLGGSRVVTQIYLILVAHELETKGVIGVID